MPDAKSPSSSGPGESDSTGHGANESACHDFDNPARHDDSGEPACQSSEVNAKVSRAFRIFRPVQPALRDEPFPAGTIGPTTRLPCF